MSILESQPQEVVSHVVNLPFDSPIPLSYLRPSIVPVPRHIVPQGATLGEDLMRKLRAIEGVTEVFYDTTNRCRLIIQVVAEQAIHIEDIILTMIDSLEDECRQLARYLLDSSRMVTAS